MRVITYLLQFIYVGSILLILSFKYNQAKPKQGKSQDVIVSHILQIPLRKTNGTSFSLTESVCNGLLIIYFNTECPTCLKELDRMEKFQDEFEGIKVIFISEEETSHLENVEKEYSMFSMENMEMLVDYKYQFSHVFGASSYPTMFVFDSEGQLLERIDNHISLKTLIKITKFANRS